MPRALGVVDAVVMPDQSEAEFSILLRSDLKGSGLGKALMQKIIAYCTNRGFSSLLGIVLRQNQGMRGLASRLGFVNRPFDEEDMVLVALPLPGKEGRVPAKN